MNFAQNSNPASTSARLALVVIFHVILGYVLVVGLGRKVVDILNQPLDVSIIEEIKKVVPPPPPPPPPPTQRIVQRIPKVDVPPTFVPPPEVRLETPPEQNVIVTSGKPDPEPLPFAPAPPATVAPPVAQAGPVSAVVACSNYAEVRSHLVYPQQAQQMGLSGDVTLEFTLSSAGQINDVAVMKSSHRIFVTSATNSVRQLHCNGQGHDVKVRVAFVYRMEG